MKKLFHKDGREVQVGEVLTSFDGEEYTLDSMREPHKPSSTGRVYVKIKGAQHCSEFFPGVFGLEWKEVDEK